MQAANENNGGSAIYQPVTEILSLEDNSNKNDDDIVSSSTLFLLSDDSAVEESVSGLENYPNLAIQTEYDIEDPFSQAIDDITLSLSQSSLANEDDAVDPINSTTAEYENIFRSSQAEEFILSDVFTNLNDLSFDFLLDNNPSVSLQEFIEYPTENKNDHLIYDIQTPKNNEENASQLKHNNNNSTNSVLNDPNDIVQNIESQSNEENNSLPKIPAIEPVDFGENQIQQLKDENNKSVKDVSISTVIDYEQGSFCFSHENEKIKVAELKPLSSIIVDIYKNGQINIPPTNDSEEQKYFKTENQPLKNVTNQSFKKKCPRTSNRLDSKDLKNNKIITGIDRHCQTEVSCFSLGFKEPHLQLTSDKKRHLPEPCFQQPSGSYFCVPKKRAHDVGHQPQPIAQRRSARLNMKKQSLTKP